MRLAGGELRGRTVAVPPGVRPTEGRVREALLSIWAERLPGGRFLDLFAGSGAVGLEAASRGALTVVAVESAPRCLGRLRHTVEELGLEGVVEIRRGELPGALGRLAAEGPAVFDLVFADPPYAFRGWGELLAAVEPLLAEGGEIAAEHTARAELPGEVGSLVKTATRRYGESALSFYRRLES